MREPWPRSRRDEGSHIADHRPPRASIGDMDSLAGMLLVAPPQLTDPNFTESVVVVLLHNESGSFGLVLNRTADAEVGDAVPVWKALAGGPIRSGGPVEIDALIGIARTPAGISVDGYREITTTTLGPLGLVDLHATPADDLKDIRLFTGYTGWGPGQLEGEILMGGWVVVPGLPSDPFDLRLEELWGRVLRRADPSDARLRLLPDDITLN